MDDKFFKRWIISVLRKATYKWRPRNEALRAAKVSQDGRAYIYQCAHCGNNFKRPDVQIDHIIPVIDPFDGFISWDTYIERLFVEKSGFQVLCKGCHSIKTELEKEIRKDAKITKDKKRFDI